VLTPRATHTPTHTAKAKALKTDDMPCRRSPSEVDPKNQIGQKKERYVSVKNQIQKSGRRAPKRLRKNVLADTEPAALKYPEACRYLGGIHVATLRRMVERGLVRPNKMLRTVLFPVAELQRALREGMVE
jgi:hypothetical protein